MKRLIRVLHGQRPDRHPFWLMRQAGRYLPEYRAIRSQAPDFVTLCLSPELAAEITLQPVRRFGMDGAIVFSDILLVPWALGQDLWFEEGEGPKLAPISGVSDLGRLKDSIDADKLEPVYETIRRVKAALPSETALIGFAGAPWTLATYMVEGGSSRSFTRVRAWAAEDPLGFSRLIERVTQAVAEHLDRQIEAGAEIVQLFDSWAKAAGQDDLGRWVIAPAREIVRQLKRRHPDVPIIGFPKAIGTAYLRYAAETGVDAVSIDSELPLAFARDQLQAVTAVQGNLDPEILVEGGPRLDDAVRAIAEMLGGGRFVFNLGHGVLPPTPPEHVARVAEILRSIPVP